jgi:hypothetical protein
MNRDIQNRDSQNRDSQNRDSQNRDSQNRDSQNRDIQPDEAARALSEVGFRQQRAVDAGVVPGWFWVANAALVVILSAGVESRRPPVIGIAVIVFALGLGATIALTVRGVPVQVRTDLIGSVGAMMIVGFVLSLVGVTIGIAFTLQGLHVRYPATLASLVCAVGLIIGGPWLMRRLRGVMTSRVASNRG